MAELLRTNKGRFLLSLNDRPEVPELFGKFQFEVVKTRHSAHACPHRRINELVTHQQRTDGIDPIMCSQQLRIKGE